MQNKNLLVVVDVQLGSRIGRTCRLEGDLDEAGAQNIVEDGLAEGSVFVEDFVANVLHK